MAMRGEDHQPADSARGTRYRVHSDVLTKKVQGETVLVQLKTDRIFTLNKTGSRLWELLNEGRDRREIQQLMQNEFDVAESQLTEEIENLLASLTSEKLIISIDET